MNEVCINSKWSGVCNSSAWDSLALNCRTAGLLSICTTLFWYLRSWDIRSSLVMVSHEPPHSSGSLHTAPGLEIPASSWSPSSPEKESAPSPHFTAWVTARMMGRDGTSGRNWGNKWPLWQIHQRSLSDTVCYRDSGGFRLRLAKTADCSLALCWAGCCSCWLLQEGCSSFHTTAPKPLAAVPRDQSILFVITINYILNYTATCVEVELLFK